MRRAFNNYEILTSEEGKPLGVSLGYDFCAEHEWGIKGIIDALGILGTQAKSLVKKQRIGLASRVNSRFDAGDFFYGKKGDYTALIMKQGYSWDEGKVTKVQKVDWKDLPYDLEGYERMTGNLVTAWNKNSFGIIIKGKEGVVLKDILEAFKNKEGLITFLGDDNPFSNNSLCLLSVSALKEADADGRIVKNMEESDLDYIKLDKIRTKLDLEGKMRKAGKWYEDKYDNIRAASVKLDEDDNPLSVWINASKNYGWYTVKQVQDFIKDKTGKKLAEFKDEK